MGRVHILPQGYHWMEIGHEERDLTIIEGVVTIALTVGMLVAAYFIFE